MKRYRFSLQKVLDYNDHLQKNEAEGMNRLLAEYRSLEARHKSLILSHREESMRFQADCAVGQTAGQAAARSAYLKDLAREIDRSRTELARQGERVEAQRKRLIAVTQEKEITEKLREHSWAEYQAAERKGEESFIEEFLANRTAQERS